MLDSSAKAKVFGSSILFNYSYIHILQLYSEKYTRKQHIDGFRGNAHQSGPVCFIFSCVLGAIQTMGQHSLHRVRILDTPVQLYMNTTSLITTRKRSLGQGNV